VVRYRGASPFVAFSRPKWSGPVSPLAGSSPRGLADWPGPPVVLCIPWVRVGSRAEAHGSVIQGVEVFTSTGVGMGLGLRATQALPVGTTVVRVAPEVVLSLPNLYAHSKAAALLQEMNGAFSCGKVAAREGGVRLGCPGGGVGWWWHTPGEVSA
jgi:hypothetical protein